MNILFSFGFGGEGVCKCAYTHMHTHAELHFIPMAVSHGRVAAV